MASTFPPRGWVFCDGQILPIEQNQALFSILGTAYGGDGRTTFGLPDLRGRVPVHVGNNGTAGGTNHTLGEKGGEEGVTLAANQISSHTHTLRAADTDANSGDPTSRSLARATGTIYRQSGTLVTMDGVAVANNSGGQPHPNIQPFTVVRFCIAVEGTFPPRN